MILRNQNLVGGRPAANPLAPEMKPIFEEGCALMFTTWTAVQLAVANEWGGSSSREKAEQLLQEVVEWFYTTKDIELSDLEQILNEALQVDFNVLAEDDSPYQVARSLFNMYHQVAGGDVTYINHLRSLPAAPGSLFGQSQKVCDNDDDSSSSDGEEDGEEDDADAMDAEGGEDMDMDDEPRGPTIDDDGFQVVERRKGRK